MNMMTLYGISEEYKGLLNACLESADDETGEVDFSLVDALGEVQERFEEKALAVADIYRALTSYTDIVAAEIARLNGIKRRLESRAEHIKDGLAAACEKVGVESMRGVHATISFRASEATKIDFPEAVPDEFCKIERKPMLTEIKKAIKAGTDVPGAHIEKKRNIQIR